ncbi:hypothetical protein [Candidatus Palauibacter sp.]|uniref:hypothetical protein n=1 Tax=Candidatus Palauibacter sp. TaxID=3101350 RepID=UPI003B01F258
MNKWLTRFVPMLAALTLTIAPSASDTALPSPADLAVEPVAFAYAAKLEKVLPQMCVSCSPCGKKGHEHTEEAPPAGGVLAYHPHDCLQGGGCDWHPSCGLGDQAMLAAADLIDSLRGSTPAQLASLVERYSHLVQINEARRVLQLIGCNNRIVASYSSQTIPALEALLL